MTGLVVVGVMAVAVAVVAAVVAAVVVAVANIHLHFIRISNTILIANE